MSKRDQNKKSKKFRSLKIALAISFLSLSSIVLLISSSLNIYFSLRAQKNFIDNQQQFIAEKAAGEVSDFILEKFTKLEGLSKFSNLVDAESEEQKILLEKLIGTEPAFRQLVFFDANGQELVKVSRLSSFAKNQLTENFESDFFTKEIEKRYTSSVYIDDVTSEPLLVLGIPINNAFGDTQGILLAEVNLKFMWDLVDRMSVGKEGVAYVVDKEGNLLAFGDISRVLKGENLIYLDEVSEFVEGNVDHENAAEISRGIEGTHVVTTHVHLENPTWAIVVELPIMEAYEDIFSQIKISLLIIVLSLIISIVLGIYLSRKITGPIINLRDASIKIGGGKLNNKIKIETNNEIGELASAFNQMTTNLKKSRNELEKYSKNLEKVVKKRTKDLDYKVNELERFQKMAVGRELKMVELKNEIKKLKENSKRK